MIRLTDIVEAAVAPLLRRKSNNTKHRRRVDVIGRLEGLKPVSENFERGTYAVVTRFLPSKERRYSSLTLNDRPLILENLPMATHEAATQSVRAALDALEVAWSNADGDAFAAACTTDVDFVNILGMYVRGRPAVSALHDKIFKGPYAGSTVRFSIDSVRPISDDSVLAIVPGEVQIPAGPARGSVITVATVLVSRDGADWKIASFHNTKREATAAELTTMLLDVQAK